MYQVSFKKCAFQWHSVYRHKNIVSDSFDPGERLCYSVLFYKTNRLSDQNSKLSTCILKDHSKFLICIHIGLKLGLRKNSMGWLIGVQMYCKDCQAAWVRTVRQLGCTPFLI